MNKNRYLFITIISLLLGANSMAGQCTAYITGHCHTYPDTLTANITGGVAPISYSWSGLETTQSITALAPGTYSVTVNDINGCTASASHIVWATMPTIEIVTLDTITCYQGYDGVISAVCGGVFFPNDYLWDNGDTLQVNWGGAGEYCVTVTDNNNCSLSICDTLVEPPPFIANAGAFPTCQGANNGVFICTTTGGAAPYQYCYPIGLCSYPLNYIEELMTGSYNVTVSDANGCTATTSGDVQEIPCNFPVVQGVDDYYNIPSEVPISANVTDNDQNVTQASMWTAPQNGPITFDPSGTFTYFCYPGFIGQDSFTYIVLDSNGTANVAVCYINVLPPGGIQITPSLLTLCVGESDILHGPPGYPAYLWSTGETTQNIIVATAGPYSLTTTDALGFADTAFAQVIVAAPPVATAGSNSPVCSGTQLDFQASGGVAYQWSGPNGYFAFIPNYSYYQIPFDMAGDYCVTVTDLNGCSASACTNVVVYERSVMSTGPYCPGDTMHLHAEGGPGASFSWNGPNGFVSQGSDVTILNAQPGLSGQYNVTATGGVCGNYSGNVNVQVISPFTATNNGNLCPGSSVTLSATCGGSYLWSTGATSDSIIVFTPGTYSVTITKPSGQTLTYSRNVTQIPVPNVMVGNTGPVCEGETLTVMASGGVSYQWDTPTYDYTNANISLWNAAQQDAGMYYVTVTNAGGCTASDSTLVIVNVSPMVQVNAFPPVCQGDTLFLNADVIGAVAYTWSGPNNFAAYTQNTMLLNFGLPAVGNYTLTSIGANGCQNSDYVNAHLNELISGPTEICNGASLTLETNCGVSYLWSNGSTQSSIEVLTNGVYTITVTYGNGATASSSHVVVQGNAPTATIQGNSPVCFGANTYICVAIFPNALGVDYQWAGPGGMIGDDQCLNFTQGQSGTYAVTATSPGGCTVSTSYDMVVLPQPEASLVSPAPICSGQDAHFYGSGSGGTPPYQYSWDWSWFFFSNLQNPVLYNATPSNNGEYKLTVIDSNNCRSLPISPALLLVTDTPTIVRLSGANCGEVVLSVTCSNTYAWSTGETTSIITVTNSGNYSVTVDNAISLSQVINIGEINLDSVYINGAQDIISGWINLYPQGGTPPYSYVWSNGETLYYGILVPGGCYTVTVTDQNGCTASGAYCSPSYDFSISVMNPSPTGYYCLGDTVYIQVDPGDHNYHPPYQVPNWFDGFVWTHTFYVIMDSIGTNILNVVADNMSGGTEGVILEVQDCQSLTAFANTLHACEGENLFLNATGYPQGSTYQWSGPNNFISNTQNPSINGATPLHTGHYQVIATAPAGFMDTAFVDIIVNPAINAALFPNGNVTTCSGDTILLTASGGIFYDWNNGATTAVLPATQTALYTVIVYDADTVCSDTLSANVVIYPSPVATATNSGPLCSGQDLQLDASGGDTYTWSGPNGFQSILQNILIQNININQSGVYTVVVTDTNGCTATASTQVVIANGAAITPGGPTAFCDGGNVVLTATCGVGYLWSGGETSASITVTSSGTYTVTITDVIGNDTIINQLVDVWPSPSIAISGNSPFCPGTDLLLNANGGVTYAWTGPGGFVSNNPTPVISPGVAGIYNLVVTDANGCTANSDYNAIQQVVTPLPLLASPTVCFGDPLNAEILGGATLHWSSNDLTATFAPSPNDNPVSVTFGQVGTQGLIAEYVDQNGCELQSTALIQVLPLPNPNLPNLLNLCFADTSTLMAQPGVGSFIWNTGATTASIEVYQSGFYAVTMTGVNGCIATDSTTVAAYSPITASIAATQSCVNTFDGEANVFVLGGGGGAPYSYHWSNGGGSPYIQNLAPGAYSVTITDAVGCHKVLSDSVAALPFWDAITTHTDETCLGNDGTATCSAPPGTLFHWSNGYNDSLNTGLSAGWYYVTATNAVGCRDRDTAHIDFTLNYILLAQNATCGLNNGMASVSFVGNPPLPSYLWSNGQTTPTATGLAPGYYSVTVFDGTGCQRHRNIYVGESYDCYVVIGGYVWNDATAPDCAIDPATEPIQNIQVRAQNGGNSAHAYSNWLGYYEFTVYDVGNWYVNIPNPPPSYMGLCGLGQNVYAPVNGQVYANYDFYLTCPPPDLRAEIVPGPARPGFTQLTRVYAYNDGCNARNGTLFFTHDALLTDFFSVPPADSYNPITRTASWNFTALAPTQSFHPQVYMNVPVNTPLLTPVEAWAEVHPLAGDNQPTNNFAYAQIQVTAAIDPNNKIVSPAGSGPEGFIPVNDSTLVYVINFQNTGTDTAFSVLLRDTLDILNLDEERIVPIGASHPYQMMFEGDNGLVFHFENINLPDSNRNEPASHGYVAFKIWIKPGRPVGTQIRNRAAIYFDYNAPVITNTALVTLADPVGLPEPTHSLALSVFPNPATDRATLAFFVTENTDLQIDIQDAIGQVVRILGPEQAYSAGYHQIELVTSGLAAGTYFLRVKGRDYSETTKLILER